MQKHYTKHGKTHQSKKASAAESFANVLIGYLIALLTQAAIFPIFALEATLYQHAGIAAIFTIVSLIRSYSIRRLFNWLS